MPAALAVAGILAAGPALAAEPPQPGPERAVAKFHAALIEMMKIDGANGAQKRYAYIAPAVAALFDSRTMIALATGRYWRAADADKRRRLATAFRLFSTASYATRFTSYSGQHFETLGVDAGPRSTWIVRTRLVTPDEKPVALGYVARRTQGQWSVIDVLVDEGVSELAIRRSEYIGVLRKGGVDALIRLLGDKAAAMLAE